MSFGGKINSTEVQLVMLNHHLLPPELLREQCLQWLDEAARARYERLVTASSKHEFLAGQSLLRLALSKCAGIPAASLRFKTNQYGKPQIDNALQAPLYFNLTHSGDYLVVAIAQHEFIGVDIEYCGKQRRAEKIADRYFSRAEVDVLLSMPPEQQQERFYDLWTLKEAYIKARGMGLALSLQHFGFEFVAENTLNFWVDLQSNDEPVGWHFWQLGAPEHYKLALALKTNASIPSDNLRLWQLSGLDDFQSEPLEVMRSYKA